MPAHQGNSIEEQRKQILRALDIQLPQPKLSPLYRTGILLVALIMILLPLIYVGLVGLVGYGVYYHADQNTDILTEGSGRGRFLGYFGPIVVGAVLIFFMIKPLFARRRFQDDSVEVKPSDQPFLYKFVEHLCAAVGAPAPRRILVDCTPNASAGFHQGGTGMTKSGRELRIGLPLVAAMPLRQVAGILAHEFGHFSQGTGMRLSFTVARVNAWFARVVFERDSWDERLRQWDDTGFWALTVIVWVSRMFVWLTRRLLHGLMLVGHAISSFMSRQMEYDADRYEIALAGSESFSVSMRELPFLGVAQEWAISICQDKWSDQRLPDNLTKLSMSERSKLSDEVQAKIRDSVENEKSHVFATHPRSIDRIREAEAAESEGVFRVKQPATILFDGFEKVCEQASEAHFRAALGDNFESKHMVSTDTIIAEVGEDEARRELLQDYFKSAVNALRPLPLPSPPLTEPENPGTALERVHALRELIAKAEQDHDNALRATSDSLGQQAVYRVAEGFLRAKIDIDADDFGLDKANNKSIEEAHQRSNTEIESASKQGEALEALCSERLTLALQLLTAPDVAAGIEHASDKQQELLALLPAAQKLGATIEPLCHVRNDVYAIERLYEAVGDPSEQPELMVAIDKVAEDLRERLTQIQQGLQGLADPLPTDEPTKTVAELYLPDVPSTRHLDKLHATGRRADDKLFHLYLRVLGRIVEIAHETERVAEQRLSQLSG